MDVSVQLSLYPLRQQYLTPAIRDATEALERHGLQPRVGTMSTQLSADAEKAFAALRDAFGCASRHGDVVMTVTISNACPK